jgi:hypothetical protein
MSHDNYHTEWQTARVNFLIDNWGSAFFKGKTVLELGSYNGFIGNKLSELGALVQSVDGRQENVDYINRNYPHLNAIVCNLDSPDWSFDKWDIIVNFGLLYHLETYHKEHIVNCIQNCNTLFLESVIFDSNEPEIYTRHETGPDQSLTDQGGTPSTSYVENIFREQNLKFTRHFSRVLNGGYHVYDWQENNTRVLNPFARRMWYVEAQNKTYVTETPVDSDDVTILIQGLLARDAFEFYIQNYTTLPVVLSIWEDDAEWLTEYEVPANFTILRNKQPSNNLFQNILKQTKSTLDGLDIINTQYVIKLRGDEYYSNLECIINLVKQRPEQIITNSVFARHYGYMQWHISDHLIAGTLQNLRTMFLSTENQVKTVRFKSEIAPEVILTKSYLKEKYGSDFESRTDPRTVMRESFTIVDVNELKPYKVVANAFRKKWFNNFDNLENQSVTSIHNMFH